MGKYQDSTEQEKAPGSVRLVDIAGQDRVTDNDRRIRRIIDSTDYGESIRQVSTYVAADEYVDTDYINCSSADEMDFHVRGRNSVLIDTLAARLAPGALHLVRRSVDSQRDGRVIVTTSDESFTADARLRRARVRAELDPVRSAALAGKSARCR